MEFETKRFDELTTEELYEIMKSRNEIFVVEQDCIYQDCDDLDYGYHVFARDESGRVTAYMRIYEIDKEPDIILYEGKAIWSGNLTEAQIAAGEVLVYERKAVPGAANPGAAKPDTAAKRRTVQMGRVLTLVHGQGLGGELLREGIRTAWDVLGADRIFIEAEDYVEGYYAKAGFVRLSDVFLKDDIPHIRMELIK